MVSASSTLVTRVKLAPELVERLPGPADGIGIGSHELLPSAALLTDEADPLQHGDVLLHRGEAHRVGVGQLRHRKVAPDRAAQDVATGGIGQRVKQMVYSLVGQLTYNHLVVD
jgi:hypothetical protein